MIKVSEAAKLVPFSREAVLAAAQRGTIKSERIDGMYYVDPDDLIRWSQDPMHHPNMNAPEGYITISDAAKLTFFAYPTIQKYIYSGDIECIQIGRRKFVKKESVEQWAKRY